MAEITFTRCCLVKTMFLLHTYLVLLLCKNKIVQRFLNYVIVFMSLLCLSNRCSVSCPFKCVKFIFFLSLYSMLLNWLPQSNNLQKKAAIPLYFLGTFKSAFNHIAFTFKHPPAKHNAQTNSVGTISFSSLILSYVI